MDDRNLSLPAPFLPGDIDLRDFPFMPLDVVRLRDSDLVALESAEAFRAAVMLWCASWHQIPAGSLPDDDRVLANLAGYGRVVKEWLLERDGALRGWVKCSDGRLYHPVIAEKAADAWAGKLRQRWATECARIKKHNQRHPDNKLPELSLEEYLSQRTVASCPQGQPRIVPKDNTGSPEEVPGETDSKGQGERQRQGISNTHRAAIDPGDAAAIHARSVEISILLRKQGASLQAQDPRVMAWAQEGFTNDELSQAVEAAKIRRTADNSNQPINAGLLDAIARDRPAKPVKFDPVAHVNQGRLTQQSGGPRASTAGKTYDA